MWGDKAVDAIYSEFAQIHNQKALKPIHAHKLIKEQKRCALNVGRVVSGLHVLYPKFACTPPNTHSMDIYSRTRIPLSEVTNHMSVRAINAAVASKESS